MFRLTVLIVALTVAHGAVRGYPDIRISGGWDTTIDQHPYQVSVQHNNNHFCAGILVSSTWVLTAAHCITLFYNTSLTIRAGSTYRNNGGQTISVSNFVIHESWDFKNSMEYDLAALRLASAVTVSTAKTATLATASTTIADWSTVVVTGWGSTDGTNTGSDTLKEVQVPVITRDTCTKTYGTVVITTKMFCAGTVSRRPLLRDCDGDAGGPGVINNVVVGMNSWAIGCGVTNYPGIFLKISEYRSWITQKTGV